MLPFARAMAPLVGASCIASVYGSQNDAIPPIGAYGGRAGDYLIFASTGTVPSDWAGSSVNLGNATGTSASIYGKPLTASDVAGSRQTGGWWAVLVYRDVLSAAALTNDAAQVKSPRYLGVVALFAPNDQYGPLIGMTARATISAAFTLYDRTLPFDPYPDGTRITASQNARIIELRR